MYDVVTIGSAVADIYIESSHFQLQKQKQMVYLCQPYDEKMEVESFEITTGGGGGNTAVGFARMGFSVAVVTETGKDVLSQLLLDDFHREKVATNLIVQERKEQTGGSVILLGKDGCRTILVHRGASSLLDPHDIPVRKLQQAEWVHLASIAGRKLALESIFQSRRTTRRMSWNPGSAELDLINNMAIDITQIPCDVLQLNESEWQKVANQHQRILQAIPTIIVTAGGQGVTVYTHDHEPRHVPVEHITPVDGAGAGDSFLVGCITGMLKGQPIMKSVEWGLQNARSVILKKGAKPGLLTFKQLT